MPDDTGHPCAHCGGIIYGRAETCSDVCKKIAAGTHWPTQAGPASHDEIVGWIEERDLLRRRAVRQLAEDVEAWAFAHPFDPLPDADEFERRLLGRFHALGLD